MANKREIALRFFKKMKDAGFIKPNPTDGYYLYTPEGKSALKAAVDAPYFWSAAFTVNYGSDNPELPIKDVWLPFEPSVMDKPGQWRFLAIKGSHPDNLFRWCIEILAEKLGLDMTDDEYVDIDDLVF